MHEDLTLAFEGVQFFLYSFELADFQERKDAPN